MNRPLKCQSPPRNRPNKVPIALAALSHRPVHVLPRAVPDMDPHGCLRNAIDDYVPGICNRKAALAAPGCRHANSRMFENQIESVLDALSDKSSGARVFVSDVRKGINVGLQRPRRPLKLPGGACGHGRHRLSRVPGAAPLHAAHIRAASHRFPRLCFR